MECFFLLRRTLNYIHENYSPLFSGKSQAKYAGAAKASGINGFGWYLQIKSVAEKNVFTHNNLSAIKSVERTNLYDFLLYITANASENLYQEKIREYDARTSGR